MSSAARPRVQRGSFTQAEIALRDEFVAEYARDHNGTMACIRMGFAKSFASKQATDFLTCPYVANKLADLAEAPAAITPEFIQQVEQDAIARLANEIRHSSGGKSLNLALKSWRLLVPPPREAETNDLENTLAETLARFAQKVDL